MDGQFNAIDYVHELVTAGVPQMQAEVHAKALTLGLSTCAATKGDLLALEERFSTRMGLFEAKIEARLDAFEAKMEARMSAFEAKLEARMSAFEAKMEARMSAFEAKMEAQMSAFEAKIIARLDAFEAARKYDRRVINFVLALQVALIAKAFLF